MTKSPFSFILLTLLITFSGVTLKAQEDSSSKIISFKRNQGGPRIGVLYIADNGPNYEAFNKRAISRWMSLFGWEFEYQIVPKEGAATLFIEFLPCFAGVEQGAFFPYFSFLFGIRTLDLYELSVGPNSIIGTGDISTIALAGSIGKSFEYGGITIPLNLMFASSGKGSNLSFQIGYTF